MNISTGTYTEHVPSFLEKPAPISDVAGIKEFDLVVVGAGSSGIPAALAAAESGAKVAVVQKEATAAANGNIGAGINLGKSDSADLAHLATHLEKDSDNRPKRELIELWIQNSGEAISWLLEKGQEAGAQIFDLGNGAQAELIKENNYKIDFVSSFFGPKPYDTGAGMRDLAELAVKKGVKFFYDTPARQLVKDGDRIIGVIGEQDGKYIQFNAKKAVIIATGDYQNDEAMKNYYLPDAINLENKRTGRTGDGHKMIVWAGGKIENIAHTKMCHDMDSGPMWDMPFLRVKKDGNRFCNETLGMSVMCNYLLSKEDSGNYYQIFDSAYMEKMKDFSGTLTNPEDLKNFMPEEDIEHKGVMPQLIATFKADTLEELADKLKIDDKTAFIDTVKQYNAMAGAGEDTAFGVPAKYMKAIDTPPYYGIHKHIRFTHADSGVEVNGKLQCLTPEGKPIPGLYAAGNVAGNFYGANDYPLTIGGLNLGHNYTEGYFLGKNWTNL
ncbi:FAD-dependent oxidoreductase [Aminipila luticellarii]|uniref:FAD-dependent oxidoreductase n=2 Tax=Aminipila luticellarii TaxID=2507160 RepID=A0A410PZ36_9FIRM|nr:FAD-dependent oxidoreductase [Aminipila luticellarii]